MPTTIKKARRQRSEENRGSLSHSLFSRLIASDQLPVTSERQEIRVALRVTNDCAQAIRLQRLPLTGLSWYEIRFGAVRLDLPAAAKWTSAIGGNRRYFNMLGRVFQSSKIFRDIGKAVEKQWSVESGQEETVARGQWSVAEDENGKTRRREDVKKARERGRSWRRNGFRRRAWLCPAHRSRSVRLACFYTLYEVYSRIDGLGFWRFRGREGLLGSTGNGGGENGKARKREDGKGWGGAVG